MATSQTEEITGNKPDSEESGTVQESAGKQAERQEAVAAEEATAKQETEETLNQKAEAEAVEEKTEVKTEIAEEVEAEAKPAPEDKTEEAEKKDEPEAETRVEEKAEAVEEKTEAKPEAAEEPKAEEEEEAKAKAEPEAKAKSAEEKDKLESETKVEGKAETESKAKERAEDEEEPSVTEQSQESTKGEISETIQKMSQSPAILPGESGKHATANISVSSAVCAKDIMQKEVVWADSEESVQDALTKMQQQDSGYIMIGKDGILEGIVSKSNLTGATSIYLRPIFAKWHGPSDDATLQIKLRWIMSRPVRTVRPETPLATIIENICRFGGRSLPVVDEQGKVQGLITVFDIFQSLLNTSEDVSTFGKTAETPALT